MQKKRVIEMQRLGLEQFEQSPKLPLTIVLDDIRSMNNVGSVFRTADAFRLEEIIICGITARPPHPDIHKTALGAEDSVAWRYYSVADEAIEELLNNGYHVLALEQAHGSTLLSDFAPKLGKHYALVLGNEVYGVKQSIVSRASTCLEIPQYGTKHSLNVSVAAGIAIWQICAPMLNILDMPQ